MAAVAVIGVLAAIGVYAYVSSTTEPVSRTDNEKTRNIDTSVLPDDAKAAITTNLDITPEEYLKQSQDAVKLDDYKQAVLKDNSEEFAGVYLDRSGSPHLNVTTEAAKKEASNDPRLPAETRIKIVANSYNELDATSKEVEKWVDTLPKETKQAIGGIAANVPDNNVVVIVKQTDDTSLEIEVPDTIDNVSVVETNDEVDPSFPVPIYNSNHEIIAAENSVSLATSSEQVLPTSPIGDGSIYGGDGYGVEGTMNNGSTGMGYCSLGFNGKDKDGNPIIFTAGHCATSFLGVAAENPGVSSTLRIIEGDVVTDKGFGEFIGNKHGTSDGRDVAIAKVTDLQSKFTNAEVRTGDSTIKVTGKTNPVFGMPVCKSGRTTGYTCGRVYLTSLTLPLAGSWTKKLFVSTACARPGDSGGAVFTGTKALGLTTGGPMLLGTDAAGCFKKDLLSVLFGRITYMTPINEALDAFPGTKLNTTSK